MGQQQLLLIILGIIMVGIAIAAGIALFGSWSVASNKDGLYNDLQNLAAGANQFKARPANLGGGSGKYTGYAVPIALRSNDNGTFTPTTPVTTQQSVTFVATSTRFNGTITATLDSTGQLGNYVYTDDFL
jgi:hypothetical protein